MSRSQVNLITKIYTDDKNPAGFASRRKVYEAAKKTDPRVTQHLVNSILSSIPSYNLHKKRRLRFKTRPHLSPGLNHYFQMDLMVLNDHLAKLNKNKYILFAIDIFSKKLHLRPLKTKQGVEVARAIHSIIKSNNSIPPLKVSTDKGTEFRNSHVNTLFDRYNIIHFTSENLYHSSIVERSIRTLREKFGKYMTQNNTAVFIPRLQNFVESYNNTEHSSLPTEMSPNSVNRKNEFKVWQHQYASILRRSPSFYKSQKLKVGQHIKLTNYPHTFRKSSDTSHTRENFIITKVLNTHPTTYIIADLVKGDSISGAFYREEIQPIVPN